MRYILSALHTCSYCMACEEFLPGFIKTFGGRQQVTEHWIQRHDVVLAIDKAARTCPQDAISLEVLE